MQRFSVLLLATALVASPARADGRKPGSGEAMVLAMLKTNTVVQAAVAQGRRYSGAKTCQYEIKATQPKEFEPNTTYDYDATITCGGGNDSTGLITVTGRLFKEGPQALKLSLAFAD